MTDFTRFDAIIDEHLEDWIEELLAFCRIPSEGGDRANLRLAADWTAERLRRAGCAVEVLELGDGVPPLVVGELGDGPRTLSSVGHYDVQPAAPLDLWTNPPYDPAIRDDRIYARGATDNKGELLPRIWALEAWVEAFGPLPVRVRHLVEGEEETGSVHLDELLDLRPELRRADAALIEGGELDLSGRPSVQGGGKGIIVLELVARTMAHDAHSSLTVVLPNAAQRIVKALATLWDDDLRPVVDGLDTGARPPTPEQLAIVDAQDTGTLDDIREDWQVDQLNAGLDGVDALRALTFDTTLNIQGLWSGHIDATAKTVTPAEARARIDIRIIPDQDPPAVVEALRRHLDAHGFADIGIIVRESEPAWWTPPSHPVVQAAAAVSTEVAGMAASIGVSFPGTVPMHQVCAEHRVPATTLGAGRADCRAHAPDENIRIDDLVAATKMMGRFLDAFAKLPEVPPVP
jgi:acetylornithine deacetylase/succinyl-diaminopimelate desuccinylase-like protein